MKFREWFKDEDHDLYNYPEEAMQEAWNAATGETSKEIEQRDKVIEAAKEYMSPHEPGKNLELERNLVIALIQLGDK